MSSEQYRGGGLVLEAGAHDQILGTPMDFVAPEFMDVSMYLRPLENQGDEPMCAAYAVCCIAQGIAWKLTGQPEDFEEAPLYVRAKQIDGLPPGTLGTTEIAALKAAMDLGYLPPGTTWYRVPDYSSMRFALHRTPWVIGGFSLHENWQPDQMAHGQIPDQPRMSMIGAHEVALCGYTTTGHVVTANSWGWRWGDRGYGTMSGWSFQQDWLGGRAIEV